MKKKICFGSVIFVLFLMYGCGTVGQLDDAKKHWAKKDYEWIAKQEVTCGSTDDGCNQLHLIKGDACYQLAKSGRDEKVNYECAMTQLDAGISQTKEGKMDELNLNRAQTYENLCESIRNLQDLNGGAAAEELTKKLVFTSQAFLSAEPGNLAGIYFLNSARYTLLRRCLINPDRCPGLCDNLKAIQNEIETVMPKAEVSRYMDNYHRLMTDIAGAKRTVAGCQ